MASPVVYVADRTALKALVTSTDTVAFLKENGREGLFEFDPSNLSVKVTADPAEGIYVAPTSGPTGASGAWVRSFDTGYLNVKWFGATGNGTTDDKSAIQAAIDFSESLISTISIGGLTVFLPRGGYKIESGLSVRQNHIVFRGEGKESSVIFANSPSFTLIDFDKLGTSLNGVGVVDMAVSANGNATAGALIRMDDVTNGYFQNLTLRGWWNGIDLVGCNRTRLMNIEMHQGSRSAGAGNSAIRLLGDATAGVSSDIHMMDMQIVGQGPAYASGLFLAGVDGLYVENSHFIQGDRAVHCLPDDAAGQEQMASIKFVNCYFDTAPINHVYLAGTAGSYRSLSFANCTFRDAQADSFLSSMASPATVLSIVGCNFRTNGKWAINCDNSNLSRMVISACIFDDNNKSSGAGDIKISGGNNIIVTGCDFVNGSASGTTIDIGTSVNGMILSQSYLAGSVAATKISNAGANVFINSVRGYILKSSGTATIPSGSTSVTVNHGLSIAPTSQNLVGLRLASDAPGVTRFWANPADFTATQFVIRVNAAPTANATFVWAFDAER